MTTDTPPTNAEVRALRDRLDLIWANHEREHGQHDAAHGREHEFAQKAIETAATLAKENKADANEWRGSMLDRERTFATKVDVGTILSRLDSIERANIKAEERERGALEDDAEEKREAERRTTRGQWVVGVVVGLVASVAAVLINLVLRGA